MAEKESFFVLVECIILPPLSGPQEVNESEPRQPIGTVTHAKAHT